MAERRPLTFAHSGYPTETYRTKHPLCCYEAIVQDLEREGHTNSLPALNDADRALMRRPVQSAGDLLARLHAHAGFEKRRTDLENGTGDGMKC